METEMRFPNRENLRRGHEKKRFNAKKSKNSSGVKTTKKSNSANGKSGDPKVPTQKEIIFSNCQKIKE